jgi:hypothetical protein
MASESETMTAIKTGQRPWPTDDPVADEASLPLASEATEWAAQHQNI